MQGFCLHLYSKKHSASVESSPYTYFGDGHQTIDVLMEWAKEQDSENFRHRLNQMLPDDKLFSKDNPDLEDLMPEILKEFTFESSNTVMRFLKEKEDFISHWIAYYHDVGIDLSDYNDEYDGLIIIRPEDVADFISDMEKGLKYLQPSRKINVGFKEFIDFYNNERDKSDEFYILIQEDYVDFHGKDYLLEQGLVSLKEILLSTKFHNFLESIDKYAWEDEDFDANSVVGEFISSKYKWKDIMIKHLIEIDGNNIFKREDVINHLRYPDNPFLEDLL